MADPLTWIAIEDFTPGIITNSALAYAPNGTNGNTGPVPGNKAGQAQSAVGCIALPSGGLAPLPGLVASFAPTHAPPASPTLTYINGLFIGGPFGASLPSNNTSVYDDLIYGQEEWNSSTGWKFYLEEIQTTGVTAAARNTLMSETGGTWPNSNAFHTMTGDYTRANATPADVGVPCLAFGYWWHDATATIPGYVGLYPDPTAPTSGAPNLLSTTLYADVLTHQNRIVLLVTQNSDWGSSSFSPIGNELFNYTDPPNSLALGTQNEVFVQETPFGHGAWGSINASELVLIKNRQGGYFIEGDLNNPTVVRLPGLISSHTMMSRGDGNVLGFVYAAQNRGVWAWQGGQNSVKLSNQLDDDFYSVSASVPGIISHGPSVDVRHWGDWLVVSNDWIMDTNLGGWWKLPPSGVAGQAHQFYAESSSGNFLYATIPTPTSAAAIDVYDRQFPTNSFTWSSYPMRLGQGSKENQYSVQEIVLRAQGDGTVTVVITGVGGTTSAAASSPSETLTFDTTAQPSMQMIRVGIPAQDVTVSITSTGATNYPAPVVYSVAVGYVEQNPVSAT